jgi:hypothetical protein
MRLLPLFMILAALVVVACTPDRDPVEPGPGSGTGVISVGPFVSAGSVPVGPAGGTINITNGPISGLQLEVAPNAFAESKTVTVSSAPVTGHSLGADFNPISPMIRVDYGGGYAAEPMLVRAPVRVPAGHFAMGFYYDEDTGEVEGIPVAGITDSAIVLVTRHFSGTHLGEASKGGGPPEETFADFIIASIRADKLREVYESGFRPGVDDWEFPNLGSYISPGGHCAGQSLTAIWYYSARKLRAADPPLYDRFSTFSGLWQDNRDGYRFASVVQADYDDVRIWDWIARFDAVGTTLFSHDELHYLAFAYSIHLSHKPQLVGVKGIVGGHAMIVYRTNNRVMSIADPNFPSAYNHFITLKEDGTFQPYESRPKADAAPVIFPNIYYLAKTALMSFEGVAGRYSEMQSHTIGDYPPNTFPPADLMWLDGTNWKELADTLATDLDTLTLVARCQTCGVVSGGIKTTFTQLSADGNELHSPYVDDIMRVPLTAGDNRLYFNITGRMNAQTGTSYIDFKTVVIRKQAIETYPITNIGQATATGGGNIATDGGFPITARGVCWRNASNPTIADSHTTDGSGTGVFASNLTGLTPDTLYCVRAYATNSVGTTYGNQVTFRTATDAFYIGQHYGGGVIFYIDDSGRHGLISATSDQSTGATWGCYTETPAILFGTSQELGTGQANTTAIVNGCAEGGIAARICDALFLDGYSDWFLPSRNELARMFTQRDEIGGFTPNGYWSSSENTGYNAWVILFRNLGGADPEFKNQPFYVRAIRAF